MVKGGDDDEWQTVRSTRRRTTGSTQATVSSLKKNLPIPVVPLAIRALAVEETEAERLQRERERAVKALKKKKRAASLKEQALVSVPLPNTYHCNSANFAGQNRHKWIEEPKTTSVDPQR